MMGGVSDFVDRTIECILVGLRWLGEAGKFSDKLQRRRANFVIRRRRRKVMQGFDGSTHDELLTRRLAFAKSNYLDTNGVKLAAPQRASAPPARRCFLC